MTEDMREELIIEVLTVAARGPGAAEGMDTLQIARTALGPGARCADVNPVLYSLLSKGTVVKVGGAGTARPDAKPGWRLA
jgi:hypothetical protein